MPHPVLLSLLISVIVNAAFFAYAAIRRTDVVTDLSYSLSFALVTLATALLRSAGNFYALLLSGMIVVWALRLGSYLFTRIIRVKVDHRFDGMRDDPLKFARFWILQAVTVTVVLTPVSIALASELSAAADNAPGALSWLGFFLWGCGLLIEALADAQKSSHKRKGIQGFIRTGLWAWSRHPNYFGEALAWTGVYVYCLPSLGSASIPALISPLGISALLLFVSGVPLLEKAADAKYADQEEYEDYKRSTSIFVPLPPRKPR